MGADFAGTPVNNLILRRPRSGVLEGPPTDRGKGRFAAPVLLPTLRDAAYGPPQGEVRM